LKDDRLWRLKIAATRDLALSDGACRLLHRICDWLYSDRHRLADAAFPLPWSKVGLWCGIGEIQSYRRIYELFGKYLSGGEVKGCPPTASFFLVFNSLQKQGIKTLQKQAIKTLQKQGDLISIPLRGKNSEKEGPAAAGKLCGLRPKVDGPAALENSVGRKEGNFDVQKHLADWRRDQKKAEKAEKAALKVAGAHRPGKAKPAKSAAQAKGKSPPWFF
jgi:hypothetical protein